MMRRSSTGFGNAGKRCSVVVVEARESGMGCADAESSAESFAVCLAVLAVRVRKWRAKKEISGNANNFRSVDARETRLAALNS